MKDEASSIQSMQEYRKREKEKIKKKIEALKEKNLADKKKKEEDLGLSDEK